MINSGMKTRYQGRVAFNTARIKKARRVVVVMPILGMLTHCSPRSGRHRMEC